MKHSTMILLTFLFCCVIYMLLFTHLASEGKEIRPEGFICMGSLLFAYYLAK